MFKKIIVTAILLAVVGTAVNDVGRWVTARSELNRITEQAANVAASTGGDRDTNGIAAAQFALQNGAVVYQYDEDEQRVHVWTQLEIVGTWVARPLVNLLAQRPTDTPLLVESYKTAYLN